MHSLRLPGLRLNTLGRSRGGVLAALANGAAILAAWRPSQLATLFQDRAGTIPVTAPGQPVGVIRDATGGPLGPELITNGDFANGTTGWTTGGAWVVSDGQASTNAAPAAALQRPFSPTVGKRYRVSWRVTSFSAGQVYIGFLNGTNTFLPIMSAAGVQEGVLVGQAGNSALYIGVINGFIGSIDDISVREVQPGFHLTAISDASRGTYGVEPAGGRRNMLEWTDDFTNAAWVKGAATVSQTALTATRGGRYQRVTATGQFALVRETVSVTPSTQYTLSFTARRVGTQQLFAIRGEEAGTQATSFTIRGDFVAGTVTVTSGGFTGVSHSFTFIAPDEVFVSCAFTVASTTSQMNIEAWLGNYEGINYTPNSVDFSSFQLERGPTVTPYQRVNSAFDVAEAGVRSVGYVQFDGVDDAYSTDAMSPGVDKVQMFAGVRRASDLGTGIVMDTFSGELNGAAVLYGQTSARYGFNSRGTIQQVAQTQSIYTVPSTNVLTGIGDIGGDQATVRVDGIQVASHLGDQGTGSYGNNPLFVGMRGGSTMPFNGRIYDMIVRFGGNLDPATISAVEREVGTNTGLVGYPLVPSLTLRDDFERPNTAAGTLGRAITGQQWSLRGPFAGAYPLPVSSFGQITDGAFVVPGGQIVYAGVDLGRAPTSMTCEWSWEDDGVGTDFTTLAVLCSPDDRWIDTMLHITVINSVIRIQKRVAGGAFIDMNAGFTAIPAPSLALANTVHRLQVDISGNTVRCRINGTKYDHTVTDPDIPNIVGRHVVCEHYTASTNVRWPMKIHRMDAE